MSGAMDARKFQSLIDILQDQYQHIIGGQDHQNKSSEQMVAAIVDYYEDIISCMPGNVYWLDKNSIAVGCNKNVLDMFGFESIDQYKGLSFEDMARIANWSQEAINSFKNDTLEVLRTGKPKLNIEEPPINHHDGRTIYFLTSRVPLFDQAKNLIGVVGISIDISELKQTQAALKAAKEEAEAASKAKSEFLANMSHDVKTPLSGIIGLSELLTYRLKGQENLEFSQAILTSGRRLLSFFDHCLEVFKLEAGDIALVTERFRLKAVLDEIYELYEPAIKAKGIRLHVKYDENIPEYLIGSCAGIYRVLLNLVGNAVKFTHKGSVMVTLELEQKNERQARIRLTVADTGIGIPQQKINVIFDRFTRLTPSYKGTYEGSGIGLYIVQRYVKTMQGEIRVNSEENKGSQFIITLPLQMPDNTGSNDLNELSGEIPGHARESIAIPNHGEIQARNTDSPCKILLVEDNLTAQLMGSSLLSSLNYQVEVADCGEKALEMFEPGKYDLIFMDIGLPGIQGDAVTRLIRKMENGTAYHVPIIALTAHTTDDFNINYLISGMTSVISKPLSRDQARQIIENCFTCH